MLNNYCLSSCSPAQVLNINEAVNDFSKITVYSDNTALCNECLEYSYSLDGVNWSCWLKYTDAANILFEIETDYFIRIKLKSKISKVEIDGEETNNFSTSLFNCFDFSGVINNPNLYNPYANMQNALGLYQQLSDMVFSISGIPIYYIKLKPNINSKDITFKEYTLMDVDSIKQIKLVVKDGQMPSSKPEFSEFGFDFSTDWETELSKSQFATAFGDSAQPLEGDLVYIPMMKRMWMVNGAYEEKNEGLMWQNTTFKLMLVKYEERSSVNLGDAQAFVDSIVKNKYTDLFGTDENIQSGSNTVESPQGAKDPVFSVFESDAVRKYVKMSGEFADINTKLINSPKYRNGVLVSENMYDWTQILEESFIVYQNQICGDDVTVSFILTLGNQYCSGKLFDVGQVIINIDMTPEKTTLSVLNLLSIELQSNETYFVFFRWSKSLNILEAYAAKYFHQNVPDYMLQSYHFNFNTNAPLTKKTKYNIELEQSEYKDVKMYSFDGKITNIKVFNKYIENNSILIQMLPTHQNLIINDVCRKFVEIPGLLNR